MIETLLQAGGLSSNAIIAAFVFLIYQRLGRVEKDLEKIANRTDTYEAKVDRMEGRFDSLRTVN